jgi:hypothetical protein
MYTEPTSELLSTLKRWLLSSRPSKKVSGNQRHPVTSSSSPLHFASPPLPRSIYSFIFLPQINSNLKITGRRSYERLIVSLGFKDYNFKSRRTTRRRTDRRGDLEQRLLGKEEASKRKERRDREMEKEKEKEKE